MKLLLDTQILLWQIGGDARLSGRLLEALYDTDNDIVVSDVTMWEIVIKNGTGRLSIDPDQVDRTIERDRYDRLSITCDHIRGVAHLKAAHRDPFDRLLIAQAIAEDMPILTADSKFGLYDVRLTL